MSGVLARSSLPALQSVLTNFKTVHFFEGPFPHVIIPDALDAGLYQTLSDSFPPFDEVQAGRKLYPNTFYRMTSREGIQHGAVSDLWKRFLMHHCSREFLGQLTDIFGSSLKTAYPDFERRCGGSFNTLNAVMRGTGREEADFALETQFVYASPTRFWAASNRGPHVDRPVVLIAGMLYMPIDGVSGEGGDLELMVFKRKPVFEPSSCEISRKHVKKVKTVKYAPNTLVLFMNSLQSVHAVSLRRPGQSARRYVNFVVELKKSLFETSPHEDRNPIKRWGASLRRTLFPQRIY